MLCKRLPFPKNCWPKNEADSDDFTPAAKRRILLTAKNLPEISHGERIRLLLRICGVYSHNLTQNSFVSVDARSDAQKNFGNPHKS